MATNHPSGVQRTQIAKLLNAVSLNYEHLHIFTFK